MILKVIRTVCSDILSFISTVTVFARHLDFTWWPCLRIFYITANGCKEHCRQSVGQWRWRCWIGLIKKFSFRHEALMLLMYVSIAVCRMFIKYGVLCGTAYFSLCLNVFCIILRLHLWCNRFLLDIWQTYRQDFWWCCDKTNIIWSCCTV